MSARTVNSDPVPSLRQRLRSLREGVRGRRAPSVEQQGDAPLLMLLAALGGPGDVAERSLRLAHAITRLLDYREIQQRLGRAAERGWIDGVPGRAQLFFGGLDMLRFLFEPGSARTDAERGISLPLHRLLRLLGDPVSILDPGGLTASREMVVRHLLHDFHYNPIYDLQLLRTFEGGLQALQDEASQVLSGEHPDAARLRARIPDDIYFQGLARYCSAARTDPTTRPPVIRDEGGGGHNVVEMDAARRASFQAAGQQLAELWGFLNYCYSLPQNPRVLARRFAQVRSFSQVRSGSGAHQ